jgi:hypothetical protein
MKLNVTLLPVKITSQSGVTAVLLNCILDVPAWNMDRFPPILINNIHGFSLSLGHAIFFI